MARAVMLTVYVLAFGIVAVVGIIDLGFFLTNKETISAFLRKHPSWFWGWLAATLLFFLVLGIHLFVYTWPDEQ